MSFAAPILRSSTCCFRTPDFAPRPTGNRLTTALFFFILAHPTPQQSRLQYSVSDFQNLQRRSAEEFAQASEKGIKKFAGDLLSTIDILTLALKHVPQPIPADNVALKALFDGVEMTQVELLKTLKKHGVEPINPVGEKFDPHFHEALYMAPVPGKEPGTVLEVQQVGYTLKGKSLRAAQVGVVCPSLFCPPLPLFRRSVSDQPNLSFSRTCRSGIRCTLCN